MTFKKADRSLVLKNYEQHVVTCGTGVEEAKIEDAEVVFVGYGIQAPEFNWDDYKDVDVRGKILLFLNNQTDMDDTPPRRRQGTEQGVDIKEK